MIKRKYPNELQHAKVVLSKCEEWSPSPYNRVIQPIDFTELAYAPIIMSMYSGPYTHNTIASLRVVDTLSGQITKNISPPFWKWTYSERIIIYSHFGSRSFPLKVNLFSDMIWWTEKPPAMRLQKLSLFSQTTEPLPSASSHLKAVHIICIIYGIYLNYFDTF